MHVAILAVVSSAVLHNSHSAQYPVSRMPFDLLDFALYYVYFTSRSGVVSVLGHCLLVVLPV